MKYLNLLIILLFLVSCGTKKQITDNNHSKNKTNTSQEVATPTPPKPAAPTEDKKAPLNESIEGTAIVEAEIAVKEFPFYSIEVPPVFPGCENADTKIVRACFKDHFFNFIKQHYNTKLVDGLVLTKNYVKINGVFKIDQRGKVFSINIFSRYNASAVNDEARRVIRLLPKIKPGKYNGKNQITVYPFQILIKAEANKAAKVITKDELDAFLKQQKDAKNQTEANVLSPRPKHQAQPPKLRQQAVKSKSKKLDTKEIPFNVIETPPVFPGCENKNEKEIRKCFEESIYNFIKKHFNTSVINSLALDKDHLRIHAAFKIDRNGKVIDPTFYSAKSNPNLREEILRVLNLIPQMTPGKQSGKHKIIRYPFKIYSIINNNYTAEIVSSKDYFDYLRKKESKINKNNNSNQEITSKKIEDFNTTFDDYDPIEAPNPERAFHRSELHSLWDKILQKHISKNGNVNYKAFKNNTNLLRDYIGDLTSNLPADSWTKKEILAYWINAYNALTIDLILRNYPLNSIKDINKPWDQRLWQFGDKWLNLNDIEHQILRKMDEPRIHFAIVCASKSCPKLRNKAFTSLNLDKQLTNATKEFLADSSKNNISKTEIKLSKIFKWFAKDFKQNGSLIDFLNQYSDVEISSKAKKSFKDYSWDLNE